MAITKPHCDPMVPRRFSVTQKVRETEDTYTLALAPVDEETEEDSYCAFQPGQFSMLYLFGYGEVPISISGGSRNFLQCTVRAIGSVTRAFATLEPGHMVGVRGPFGSAWPIAEAEDKDVVVLAGGLGLAPLRAAVYNLLANRSRYRRIFVLHGARSPESVFFADELRQWQERTDVSCEVTVDYAGTEWKGRVGVITQLVARAGFDPGQAFAFVCGPELMMRFTIDALKKRGVADCDIHVSMERNMKCAIGHCGHCQFGPVFVCKDGPVLSYKKIKSIFGVAEL